jgi:hypothetical protein
MAINVQTTKYTRFRGPTEVTLRGAGSSGHATNTVGAGTDIGLRVQVPALQSVDAFEIEKPEGTVIFAIDQNGNTRQPLQGVTSGRAQVVLAPAQFIALPQVIIPAPAANQAILVHSWVFQLKYGTTPYVGAGVTLFLVYHGQTSPNIMNQPVANASVVGAANFLGSPAGQAGGIVMMPGLSVDLLATPANFTTGDSTVAITVTYSIVNLI